MKRFALLLPLLGMIVAGCGKGGFSERQAAGKADTFRYAINNTPTTFDPGMVQDVDTSDLIVNIYDGLVAYGEKNTIEPRIAESYSSPDGGKTWIFKIRKGVKFHNGREVTAEDVSWTLDRNCSKEIASPTARDYLSDIVGVEDRFSGKSNHIAGVQVVDSSTLKIELDQPRAYFIGKLTYPCAFPLCKEAVGSGAIDKPDQIVGTGPFKIESYQPDQQINLVAFKDYYLGAPKVNRIERPVIKDPATRLNKFRSGELDVLNLDRKDIPGVQRDPSLSKLMRPIPRPAVYYLGFNEIQCAVLKNAKVRRAIAMAIDRTRIARDLLGGMPEAHGLVAPGVMSYRDDYKGLPFDPAKAKAELSAAGYPDGKGFPSIEMTYRAQAGDAQIVCEAAQQQLKQNLGIAVTVRPMEWGALLQSRNENKLDLYYLSWYADYLDPQNFLSFLFMSDAKLNHDGYKNASFDALCRKADAITDEAQRIQLYNQAEDILIQDGARVPLYYQVDEELVSDRVSGLKSNLFGQLPNTSVTVK
ncbi:MAG: peptide ABC transporter substrate-binding protein [Fimbriimonas sp.]|nr:peptide ABC transporter substrate-binding protein [Fimbriimonas sp.]